MRLRAQGFTLIEIAVVLAIFGLIAAGVLITGGSVFGRAGVTSLLSSIKDLAAASRDFKTRYGYFPGDLPIAGNYFTTNGGISPGCSYPIGGAVGNGIVNTPTESDCALEHLVKAGMVSKVDYNSALGKYVITSNVSAGVTVSLWFDSESNVNAVRVSNLPCEIALEIDRKLDSATTGNTPFSQPGSVIAQDASGTPIAHCSPGAINDPVPALLIKY